MFFCRPWPQEGLWAAGARALIDAVQICQRWESGVHIFLGIFIQVSLSSIQECLSYLKSKYILILKGISNWSVCFL